jgi:hypothetical protein
MLSSGAMPAASTRVLALTGAWLGLALVAGGVGATRHLQFPWPPVVIGTLTGLLLVAYALPTTIAEWARTVDVRALVLIHVTRVIAGGYFLVLYGRGELPWAFAVPGGVGDILVGLAAAVVGLLPRPGHSVLFAWNAIGLADILMVVATAARLGAADPASMAELLRLPLSLLPTFLVPIIIASHIVIFARLAARRR